MRAHRLGDDEGGLGIAPEASLEQAHLLLPQRSAVRLGGILQVRRTGGDMGAGDDQRGPGIFLAARGGVDLGGFSPSTLCVPAVGEAGRHLLAEGKIGLPLNGDAIVEVR
jgi:hypothetical protein